MPPWTPLPRLTSCVAIACAATAPPMADPGAARTAANQRASNSTGFAGGAGDTAGTDGWTGVPAFLPLSDARWTQAEVHNVIVPPFRADSTWKIEVVRP